MEKAAEATELDIYEMRGWPTYVNDSTLEDLEWTAARLLECVQMMAKNPNAMLSDLLRPTGRRCPRHSPPASKRNGKSCWQSHDRERRSLLLPDTLTLERLNRYETTLERSLFKALHELERRQAARDGQTVPLPVAVDVNLSGPAQE